MKGGLMTLQELVSRAEISRVGMIETFNKVPLGVITRRKLPSDSTLEDIITALSEDKGLIKAAYSGNVFINYVPGVVGEKININTGYYVFVEVNVGSQYSIAGARELVLVPTQSYITELTHQDFMNSTNLDSIEIPNTVTTINNRCFYNSGVKVILLPKSLSSIDYSALLLTDHLVRIEVDDENTTYEDRNFALYNKLTNKLIKYPTGNAVSVFYISAGTVATEKYAMARSNILRVITQDGLTELDDYTFFESKITSIRMSADLVRIGKHAFDGCSYLESIDIPDGAVVDEYAFRNCSILASVTFYNRNESEIKSDVNYNNWFEGCSQTITIVWQKGTETGSFEYDGSSRSMLINDPDNEMLN